MLINYGNELEVVRAINEDLFDDLDLVGTRTWKKICQIRGRHFNQVDPEAWQELCARRGYALHRKNPRGF